MANPSSTFSSERADSSQSGKSGSATTGWRRLPWAGIAALGLVLFVDRILLSGAFPWPAIASRVAPVQSVYWGVARDRVELQRLTAAPDGAKRVAVMGSSRGHTGFRQEVAESAMPDVVFTKFAHALQDPVTIHSLVPEVIAAGIDVVVLPISQMDTHRPIRLEPLPAKSTSSLSTVATLVAHAGFTFGGENRESLYRIGLSRFSNLYRFRDILGRSGANGAREFPLDPRLEGKRKVRLRGRPALGRASPSRLPEQVEQALLSPLPKRQQPWVYQLAWFAEVQPGEHAEIQMRLLGDSVHLLRDSRVRVLIFECPVHSIGQLLEGRGTHDEFLAFARGLSEQAGVWFFPLSNAAAPIFGLDDYDDLFHLNQFGGEKFTRSILAVLPASFEAPE